MLYILRHGKTFCFVYNLCTVVLSRRVIVSPNYNKSLSSFRRDVSPVLQHNYTKHSFRTCSLVPPLVLLVVPSLVIYFSRLCQWAPALFAIAIVTLSKALPPVVLVETTWSVVSPETPRTSQTVTVTVAIEAADCSFALSRPKSMSKAAPTESVHCWNLEVAPTESVQVGSRAYWKRALCLLKAHSCRAYWKLIWLPVL